MFTDDSFAPPNLPVVCYSGMFLSLLTQTAFWVWMFALSEQCTHKSLFSCFCTGSNQRLEALLVLPPTVAVFSVHTDHLSAYSIQTYPCINQQKALTISSHLFVFMGGHRHTLQTHTGLMSTVLSLKLLIWFHPFKQHTYIPFLRLALWRSYRHINTLTASHHPIFYSGPLRLPRWQINLIKLSF